MRKDILINVNSENNKVKIDNKTLGITSENLQGKIIFKPEPFVDGVCRLYVDGKGSILMDKQEDCYTVNILSSLLTEDSLDVCFKITEPETEDGIPIFCSKIMHFRVLETIDSSSTIPEDYPSWEQVLDSMMAKVEQMESDAEDRLDEVVGQIQDLTSAYNSNATNKTNEFNTNATNKTTAFNQNYASKVTEIDGAVNSAKTELDDYTEDKKDEIDGSVDDLKSELDTYETAKEGELDSHTSTKKTELNTYTNSKKSDLDDYEETKETALNTLAGNLTSAFNSNANSKTSDFNDNATSKTGDFNTNATNKTSAYDENASTKLGAYNTNHTTKLAEYNSNATSKVSDYNTNATTKTSEFDQNASDKTDDFDDNASAKTTAFNDNATAKIAEYDAHVSELQSQIDDLTTLVETELESNSVEGTEIDVSDSAEYKGKVEVKGNTYQKQLSGKNLWGGFSFTRTMSGVTHQQNADGSINVNGTTTGSKSYSMTSAEAVNNNRTITLPAGTYCLSGGVTNVRLQFVSTDGTAIFTTNSSGSFTLTEETEGFVRTYVLENTSVNNETLYIQLEQGSTATDWEPYCRGQEAPNPSYEIPIKVVTGDNVVKHVGKNLFNYITNFRPSGNGLTNILNSDGSISVSGTPNSQYTRIVNETDITDILKDNTTYTASQSIFRTDEKNVSIEIKRIRADESTSNVKVSNNSNKVSFTVDKSEFVRYTISFLTNTVQPLNFTTTLQLEEGTTPTQYEPYREEEYKLDFGGKNIFDNTVEKKNAYPSTSVGSRVVYTNSNATDCYVNCCYLEAGKSYVLSWKQDETPVSTNKRIGCIVDDNNIILSTLDTWENSRTSRIITPSQSGYLILPIDKKATDIQIEEGTTATRYSPYVANPIELCKIGDYSDILFKNEVGDENYNAELEEETWYKKAVIKKVIFDGNEDWSLQSINSYGIANFNKSIVDYFSTLPNKTYTNLFSPQTSLISVTTKQGYYLNTNNTLYIRIDSSVVSTVEQFKTWLSTHNLELYYVLLTPIYTQITDPTLISQLEALRKAKWFKGINHWWTETENLEPNLKETYKQSNNLRIKEQDERLDNLESRLALLE